MKKNFWIAGLVFALALSSVGVEAAVITLRNGKQVTGKIVEETKHSLRVMVNGASYRYFFKEIVDIARDENDLSAGGRSSAEDEPLSPEKRELILRLLDANKARANMIYTFEQIIAQAPPATQPRLRQIMKADEIIARLVPIYAKYYTEEEVSELIAFYLSPIGVKHLEMMPQIIDDTMQEAVKYFQEKIAAQDAP